MPWNSPYDPELSRGRVLFSSFPEQPKHFDPVSSYSENEAVFLGQIYEPVLQYHYLKRPYELVPLTAAQMPTVRYYDAAGNELAPDAPPEAVASAVYTIRIKPGILFQPHPAFAVAEDGRYLYHALTPEQIDRADTLADFPESGTRELVAQDYAYQIKRLAHPRLHSPIAGFMSKYIDGLSELAAELRQQAPPGAGFLDLRRYELPGVRVIDRYTYEIHLKEKYPQFIYWLAMSFFAPVPWEADAFYGQRGMKDKNITLDWYPVGTGPFMLTDNNPNRRIVMRRNPNFRGEAYPSEGEPGDRERGLLDSAGQPMPFIDVAYYSLEKEAIPAWNKFMQGYYDVSGILSESFDQAIQFNVEGAAELTDEMRERGIDLTTAVTTSTLYMGFNMMDDVVGGKGQRARLLRRAISIAVDFEEYISIFLNGRGVPSQSPVPPGIFGYHEGREGINPYVYDWVEGEARRKPLSDAKRLLAEAGYPEGRDAQTGEPLVLYFDAIQVGPGSKPELNWYRKQFDKLGIQLVVRSTDYNRFQEKMRKGTAQIFVWGWNADYPDPENFLFLLYGPNSKVLSQGENAANYRNPEYDALFVEMKNLPNGPERQAVIDRMTEIARRDAPWLWGYHPKAYTLSHAWFSNLSPNLMARNKLKYYRIDPELRARKQREWNQPIVWPVVILFIVLGLSAVPAVVIYRRRQKSVAL